MPPKKTNQCGGGILDRFKKKSEAAKKIDALKEQVRKDRGFDKTKEERDARKNMKEGELKKQLKEKAMKKQQEIKKEADELYEVENANFSLEQAMKFPLAPIKRIEKGGGKKKKTKTTKPKSKTKKRKSQKSIFSIFSF